MVVTYTYNEQKNQLLIEVRGISFEEIIKAIKAGNIVDNLTHFNKHKYPHQHMYIVKIKNYIYVVPYVIDKNKKEIFLKTIYPNRKLTRKYL